MKGQKRSLSPIALLAAGLILIIGAAVFLVFNLKEQPSAQSPTQEPGLPYPDIKRVSLADAKAAFDLKEAVFVDARDAASYAQGHIPGALSIPADELTSRLNELSPKDWIITYCT